MISCFAVCPELCKCSHYIDEGSILDCSAAGLKTVPDMIPDDVLVIDLSHNEIEELQNDSFANCVTVKKLVVSNNKISVIRNDMLRGMPNLEIFEMENNLADYYPDVHFPDNTFDGISNLKSLSIQLNAGYGLYLHYFDIMMRKLPRTLEELNVDIPMFSFGMEKEWPQRLIEFTKLRKLGVYQVFGTIKMGNDTFKYLENVSIEEFTIRAALFRIETLTFYHLTKLRTLDIDMRRPAVYPRINLYSFLSCFDWSTEYTN